MITNKDLFIDSENGKIVLNGDKYDLGTQGEIDTAVKNVYSVMGEMGAKNLLVPKWSETQTTENGVTYTFNADGTVVMNTDESGATADTNCNLKNVQSSTDNIYPAGTYTISGCPSGGTGSTYRTWARAYRPGDSSSPLTYNLYDEGNGVTFTVNETFQLAINLTVRINYVCNNLTWKPMLRLASDTDNTYEPYAMTNKQLTEQLATKQDTLTFDNAPTQNSNNPVKSGGIYSRIGDNSGTLTERVILSASGDNSYTVTSDSAIMVAQFEGYLSAASDVYEANVQVNGLMIGYLGLREGVACNPTKREQIRIPFRVFKNDVIKITLSLTGGAAGYAGLYTT